MKKAVIISICSVVVVVALIVSLIFVFGIKSEGPEQNPVNLEGTWVVVALYNNDAPVFVEKQFMKFSSDQASMYKDGSTESYATSSYTINEAGQLLLPDISREYKIDLKTDNCVRLYENASTYMLIVRNYTDDLAIPSITVDALAGRWNVIMKGDQLNNGESLEFSGNTINYYKSGATAPSATAEFTLSESGAFVSERLGLTMKCYRVSDDTLVFVEQNGIVWELKK